jgi:hypothetical protein
VFLALEFDARERKCMVADIEEGFSPVCLNPRETCTTEARRSQQTWRPDSWLFRPLLFRRRPVQRRLRLSRFRQTGSAR